MAFAFSFSFYGIFTSTIPSQQHKKHHSTQPPHTTRRVAIPQSQDNNFTRFRLHETDHECREKKSRLINIWEITTFHPEDGKRPKILQHFEIYHLYTESY